LVIEGDDKPLKYPHMFRASDLLLINKVDLLPHVPFSVERCVENAWRVNPKLQVLLISALRGDGLDDWLGWIRDASRASHPASQSSEYQYSAD
jgi:hydrogenase nickel incorporation protein HypB